MSLYDESDESDKSDKGLRLTILGCFRYSLGRRTYMPSHTVSVIKQHKDIFTNQDWKRFIDEINECDSLGDQCDIDTWNELKVFAQNQLQLLQLLGGDQHRNV